MNLGDFDLETTLHSHFTTRSFTTGAPAALSGGSLAVYEDDNLTQITAGVSLTASFDGVTGFNHWTAAATAANGYEAGKQYTVMVSAGTVGGVSVAGEVVATFSIEKARVGAGSGLTEQQVRDAMKLAPTGGAPAAGSVDEHLDEILADVTGLNGDAMRGTDGAATPGAAMDLVANAVDATSLANDAITNAKIAAGAITSSEAPNLDVQLSTIIDDGVATYDRTTDSLQAIRDRGDAAWTTGGGGSLTQQEIRDAMKLSPTAGAPDAGSVDEHLDDILEDVTGLNGDAMRGTDGAQLAGPVDLNADQSTVTVGTVNALGTLAKADVNAEVVDVMDVDTITLPGQSAPPAAPTHRQAIAWLYKVFRNRKTQTATQWSLMADNETTIDAKAVVSDDGVTATKQEVVSGP